ncbi:hypothetical protein FHL15_005645 [Xylaria flabelliformis]|uniref:Rhodopsin domain-containing protein n=1 Tax=Xylaria flabelliformis TaxID=2512241 RepID=A0A553HZJ2_9PEZI|nr:hypothetical protein FHL15_005645 [Xylaria flabelliformis]
MAPYSIRQQFPTADLAVNIVTLTLSFCVIFTFGLITSENFAIIYGGIGQPISNVTAEELVFSAKQFITIGVTSSLAISLVKISIIDFLLSIFSAHNRFRLPAYVLIGLTAGYGISFAITTLVGCIPFAANWDKVSNPNYKCIDTSAFYSAQTIIGTILDFSTYMTTHFTEYAGIVVLLGSLEANLFIICACLPTLPILTNPFLEWIKSKFSSSSRELRSLMSGFSSKPSTAVPGLGESSSFTKLRDAETNSEEPSSRDADLESARLQRLYPMSVTMASRPSVEDNRDWSYQQAKSHTRITFNDAVQNPEALEMSNIREAAELQPSIKVTKSWAVNQA